PHLVSTSAAASSISTQGADGSCGVSGDARRPMGEIARKPCWRSHCEITDQRASRDDLDKKSGVSANSVKGFERDRADPKLSTLHKWRRALEAAGVQFLDEAADAGPGVRLVKPMARGKR